MWQCEQQASAQIALVETEMWEALVKREKIITYKYPSSEVQQSLCDCSTNAIEKKSSSKFYTFSVFLAFSLFTQKISKLS